jgi:ABC-type uncharacterized transport system substrate-binding protein
MARFLRTTLGCVLAGALLTSCAVGEKPPVFSKPEPVPKQSAMKPPPAPRKLPRVTIIVSDDVSAYSGITDELAAQLPERPVIINLQGNKPSGTELIDKINQSGNRHIVAIGSLAAQAVRQYTAGPVIFCQVFNYQEIGLTASRVQGVAMLPPAELQFRAWKNLDPGLRRVGVITGGGHKALTAEARKAAQRYGIDLVHRVVRSDKEMLYTFKRMTPDIQGLWLVPDDRVLSRNVLRDIMAYSVKHKRQVVVFHPALLHFGGLMSVSSVDSDVAQQVVAALRDTSNHAKSSKTALRPLKKIQIEVNPALAQVHAGQSPLESRVAADVP